MNADREQEAFTGDHLANSHRLQRLVGFRKHTWYSWEEQIKSVSCSSMCRRKDLPSSATSDHLTAFQNHGGWSRGRIHFFNWKFQCFLIAVAGSVSDGIGCNPRHQCTSRLKLLPDLSEALKHLSPSELELLTNKKLDGPLLLCRNRACVDCF